MSAAKRYRNSIGVITIPSFELEDDLDSAAAPVQLEDGLHRKAGCILQVGQEHGLFARGTHQVNGAQPDRFDLGGDHPELDLSLARSHEGPDGGKGDGSRNTAAAKNSDTGDADA